MVNSINPTYRPLRPFSRSKRQDESSAVEPHTDERRAAAKPKPRLERRKKVDRRASRSFKTRGSYDMRASRGRRKEDRDGFPTIEIDV